MGRWCLTVQGRRSVLTGVDICLNGVKGCACLRVHSPPTCPIRATKDNKVKVHILLTQPFIFSLVDTVHSQKKAALHNGRVCIYVFVRVHDFTRFPRLVDMRNKMPPFASNRYCVPAHIQVNVTFSVSLTICIRQLFNAVTSLAVLHKVNRAIAISEYCVCQYECKNKQKVGMFMR